MSLDLAKSPEVRKAGDWSNSTYLSQTWQVRLLLLDIAWLVSHCKTPSRRENYVKNMKKASNLQIDVMGNCGFINPELPSRAARKRGSINTYQILAQQYKFYLRAESFILEMADLSQDITRVSSFWKYIPWWNFFDWISVALIHLTQLTRAKI